MIIMPVIAPQDSAPETHEFEITTSDGRIALVRVRSPAGTGKEAVRRDLLASGLAEVRDAALPENGTPATDAFLLWVFLLAGGLLIRIALDFTQVLSLSDGGHAWLYLFRAWLAGLFIVPIGAWLLARRSGGAR